jgi:hypothetical protein
LLEQVTPQVRLGQLMVERGILTQAQLFECLTRQTEEIFRVALVTTEGAYAFTTPDRTSIGGDLTVHLPLQHLLMRTAQRLDEWALFQQLIPNANVQPRARPHAMTETMEPTARALLARCDGATPLHAIARDMGLREFEAIKVLYYLLEDEKAELASTSPPLDVSAVREATAAFSELLRDILAAVDATGSGAQARVTLRSWIESTGYATYFGDRVSDDGSIDVDTVVAVLSNLQDTDRLATLHQISHEVVSFTLFCAGQVLSRDEELALSGDVNRRLLAIGS